MLTSLRASDHGKGIAVKKTQDNKCLTGISNVRCSNLPLDSTNALNRPVLKVAAPLAATSSATLSVKGLWIYFNV